MTITAADIAGVVAQARATFPGAVLTMYYGPNREQAVTVLRSSSTEVNSEGGLSGVIEGLTGRLRLTLSDCGDWEPPEDGSIIALHTTAGVDLGAFTIIGHADDPTGTVRTLLYGEEAA